MLDPSVTRKILGGKGAKLKPVGLDLRRTKNGGYIVKHHLRDEKGNVPIDGQSPEREYHANNVKELQEHIGTHFGPQDPEDEADEEQEESQPGAAQGAA
jgi:hypothetical protein